MQNMARVVGGVFGQQRKKGWGLVCLWQQPGEAVWA